MDSKYTRRTSMGNYSTEDVCKQGFFTKSPPLHLFNNQTSWKRRHFVLTKSSNGYLLKYHKGQQKRGCIEINKNSEIEIGIGDSERMSAVKRMFKCQHSEVMTIKTEERTYYLIGTDSKDIEEWANFLFAVCKENETNAWQCQNQIPIQLGPRNRSQSSPAYLNEYVVDIGEEDLHEGNECEEISTDKRRPNSDPIPQEPCEENPIYELLRKCIPRQRLLQSNHFVCEEQTRGKPEKEEEEESEQPYYASPRSVLAKLDHVIAECSNPVANLSPNDTDGGQSGVYMSMKNLKITNDSQLEEVDIFLPQNDAINYLTITEAVGRICISQWKGPHHLNCIFHHGDHIIAVNDLHVTSTDEVFLFIKRATRKEVKLTVRRFPDSEIFHIEGCMCKEEEQGKVNAKPHYACMHS